MRLAELHETAVFADMHAHPSRFHRLDKPTIEREEIERYRSSLIDLVVCAVSSDAPFHGRYADSNGTWVELGQYEPDPHEVFDFARERLGRISRTATEVELVTVYSGPQDLTLGKDSGSTVLIAALEGADGLAGSLENLDRLYEDGLRLLQLLHFRSNEVGDTSAHEEAGDLTDFGYEVVRTCNDLGIVIELAHASSRTNFDVLAASTQPVICSHTGARALVEIRRHLPDSEIEAIGAAGGVIGVWPQGTAIPEMRDLVRHIDHISSRAGIDHVGIGSDVRGMRTYTKGFGEEANFQAIGNALLDAGYIDEDVCKVMGGNFVRVLESVSHSHP